MSTLVRTIYVGCRALGLDNDTRHDLQLRVVGKASLADMSEVEQRQVLEALKQLGFKPSAGPGKRGKARPAAPRGDIRFAHVLWGKLCRAGVVKGAGAAGLNTFVRARFEASWGAAPIDIDAMVDGKQIATVLEALKAMCKRAGLEAGK